MELHYYRYKRNTITRIRVCISNVHKTNTAKTETTTAVILRDKEKKLLND